MTWLWILLAFLGGFLGGWIAALSYTLMRMRKITTLAQLVANGWDKGES